MRRQPLLIWSSILVGLQVLAGGAALTDVLGSKTAGLIILAVAAFQASTQFYIRGEVTPYEFVAATVNEDGVTKAGPAAYVPTGAIVDVVLAPGKAG